MQGCIGSSRDAAASAAQPGSSSSCKSEGQEEHLPCVAMTTMTHCCHLSRRVASAAAETQQQVLHSLAHHQAAQQKGRKTSPTRPATPARGGYSQESPEASMTMALKAQQKVTELSQQLSSETKVKTCNSLLNALCVWHEL